MARLLKSSIGSIWIVVAIYCVLCTPACAKAEETQPRLLFRLVNSSYVSHEVMEAAKAYVERIFGHSSIPLEWVDEDSAGEGFTGNARLDLTIVFVPESVAEAMNRPKEAAGFATSNNGVGARRAYIFVQRVKQQAIFAHRKSELDEKTAEALILGHVIAHEAGHLLLPHDAHSRFGVMQARLDMNRLREAQRGNLLFMSDQTKLIRSLFIAREAD
jgi:hypothetical protein